MPRQKKYTIVRIVDGALEMSTYENDAAARDALAHIDGEPAPLVFVGEPVPFAINRTPTVTLGEPRGRKPRAKKGEGKRAKKPSTVGEVLDAKSTNGAHVAAMPPARHVEDEQQS